TCGKSRDSSPRPDERLELCLPRLPLSQSESPGRSPSHGGRSTGETARFSSLAHRPVSACLLAERSGRAGRGSNLGSEKVGGGRRKVGGGGGAAAPGGGSSRLFGGAPRGWRLFPPRGGLGRAGRRGGEGSEL